MQCHQMHRKIKLTCFLLAAILLNESHEWKPFEKWPEISHQKIKMRHLSTKKLSNRKRIVDIHNHFRASVNPPAKDMLKMRWDKRAAKDAKRWTRRCRVLVHDSPVGRYVDDFGSCGQNIFISTHKVPWLYAIRSWYSEEKDFTYGAESKNGLNNLTAVGHYTQMVWAATHRVGCAINKCYLPSKAASNHNNSKGMTYYTYICNYCPIGNFMDRLGYPYKTGTQCESCPNSCENATNRKDKKKRSYKLKRSIPENEKQLDRKTYKNPPIRSNRIIKDLRWSFERRAKIRRLRRRFCRNIRDNNGNRSSSRRVSLDNKQFKRPKYKNLPRKQFNVEKSPNRRYIRRIRKDNKQFSHGIKGKRHSRKLCTNGCKYADMWMNCRELESQWRDWLCNTKDTSGGRERFRNCKATCTCDASTTIKN